MVAATNRKLGTMVRERQFREDLYYRINVFPLVLPPLRARRGDVPALAEHFMREMADKLGKHLDRLSETAVDRLTEHDWPGNIRELRNVIERAAILADSSVLEIPPLHSLDSLAEADDPESTEDLATINRAHIIRVLESTRGIVSGPGGAAARLGLKRSTLNYRMRKLGIRREPATRGVIP